MKLAAELLASEGSPGNVLVVTACKSSTLMDNCNHGSFFWADGAAAAIISGIEGPGLNLLAYAENSSDQDWGAMRLHHGDKQTYKNTTPEKDLKLVVDFYDERAQLEYVIAEQKRCDRLIAALLEETDLTEDDISAIFYAFDWCK